MKYLTTVIVLLLATVATAEDTGKWYAIAYSYTGQSYGAAWNFHTRAAAESAAVAECEKRAKEGCRLDSANQDRCFIILRVDFHHLGGTGFIDYTYPPSDYDPGSERNLFQTEEEARHVAAVVVRRRNRDLSPRETHSLDMVACSGDPRNRSANQ